MAEIKIEEPTIAEEPIDNETAEKIIGSYVESYKRLPTEDYERSCRKRLEIPHQGEMLITELAAIVALRPKFLKGKLTNGQIEWLKKAVR
jgi:hypothetical protein